MQRIDNPIVVSFVRYSVIGKQVEGGEPRIIMYKGKRVMVFGAGGFIASHLCERLVELGANVTAFCHYNALGRAGWLDYSSLRKEMNVVFGDVTDPGTIRPANGVGDIVFHLAALIGIPYSYQAARSYIATNVQGTDNILEAANNDGAERVIVTSTSEVYGTMQYGPMDEAHPICPQSPYAASKVGGEAIALAYHLSFGLPVLIVRPFNTYGGRQSLRAVIPQIISQLLDCKANGTNRLLLGNAEAERDFTYVSDTVEGFVKAGMAEIKATGQAINLGSGACVSIAEVANLAASIIGVDNVEISLDPLRMRPGDSEVDRLLSDNSKARVSLDWKPEVCLLEGLTRTVEWFKQNRGLAYQRYML